MDKQKNQMTMNKPAIEEYPDTMGVPPELYAKRMQEETFKEYKKRLKKNTQMMRNFLDEVIGDVQMPSCRILRRIKAGKRTVESLNSSERFHIQAVIHFERHKETNRQWENRLKSFLKGIPLEQIGSTEFWDELFHTVREHRENE